jgi:hypothetical protein
MASKIISWIYILEKTHTHTHQGISINIHMFPFLHLDNKLIIQPQHKYIILRADINLKYLKSLQTYSAEDISLQTIIDQGLVHAVIDQWKKSFTLIWE